MPLREIVAVRLYRAVRDRVVPISRAGRPAQSLDVAEFPKAWRKRLLGFFPDAAEIAIAQATPLLENRIMLFGRAYAFPPVVAWNQDPRTRDNWPLKSARGINYRLAAAGDPKDIWELNRHQFLPILGKAYFISGDERYAEHAVKMILSWIDQCPPLTGINWTSGIELALRSISWLWTLKFIRRSRALTPETLNIIAGSIYDQVHYISKHLSLYSSANNHLISELAAMLILGHHLKQGKWVAKATRLLTEQVGVQILNDGVGAEQATVYQLHTTELYIMSALVLEDRKVPLSRAVISCLHKSAKFLFATMTEQGVPIRFGDGDSGHILPLSTSYTNCKSVLNLAAYLAKNNATLQSDLKEDEKSFWLLGPERYQSLLKIQPVERKPESNMFPDGGYYIIAQETDSNRVTVVFDCGPLGMHPLAGHGHSDALSFILLINGQTVLIDPGTYTYFGSDTWRNYFRGTSAHNTIRIDGVDQSVFGGLFFAIHKARSQCVECIPGVKVVGRHFGYRRLKDPAVHTRSVTLEGSGRRLNVEDDIDTTGDHLIEQFFHIDPRWEIEQCDSNLFRIGVDGCDLSICLDERLLVTVVSGDESGPLGWASAVYGEKGPVHVLHAKADLCGPISLITQIRTG